MTDVILDPLVENGQAIDFHDLMFKFTLDSFVMYASPFSTISGKLTLEFDTDLR
jgi:hypothetical protein